MTLDAHRFGEFFVAVNGHDPFPWQTQLLEQGLRDGAWPELVDVPTGLGKTSMVDIAVYALAATAEAGVGPGRRRIFFVVDRRLVVDEAWEHATSLADKLAQADNGILADVRAALRKLRGADGEEAEPLTVVRMRGGATWDAAWVDRPDQPAIVLSTVDQLGSRLLFRGYGIRDQRRPMDAALVGIDSLLLVDEAHLAQPLLQTIDRAFALDGGRLPLPRAEIVRLTATPGADVSSRFEFDVDAHLANAEARRRLEAPKMLAVVESEQKRISTALVEQTVTALSARPGARALVVCNTVDVARTVHKALGTALKKAKLTTDTDGPELLIGRTRGIDRDARVEGIVKRFGLERDARDPKVVDVLVATQTVEVGANLDVDVLVTESASLSALVQRIGRLNRLGRSELDPVAVVVHNGQSDDPLYGPARSNAWQFLSELIESAAHPVAVGPLALRTLLSNSPAQVLAERQVTTPMLLPMTLRAWAQTSPAPDPDPILDPYLHGLNRDARMVSLLWRDDIDDKLNRSNELLKSLPVLADETVDVPIRAVRAWLSGTPGVAVADLEDEEKVDESGPQSRASGAPVLVQRRDGWTLVDPRRIRPGDVVALPADAGGFDEYGWNPDSSLPVRDVRDLASLRGRRPRPLLRLDDHTASRVIRDRDADPHAELARAVSVLCAAHDRDPDADADADDNLDLEAARGQLLDVLRYAHDHNALREGYAELVEHFTSSATRGDPPPRTDSEVIPTGAAVLRMHRQFDWQIASDAGRTDSSAAAQSVALTQHHASVERRARAIAAAVGLTPDIADLVATAAGHHDLGKLDVRFQAALADGDVFLASLSGTPLAKSGSHPQSRRARAARKRSGLPRGYRHEIWSAALAEQVLADVATDTRELIVHLVATHHGNCRPYFEPVLDAHPEKLSYDHTGGRAEIETSSDASADFATVARFDRLNARFGYWGLAMLETIVRSADQTCSAEGT